jgi:opacity protein-like surface antigen
MKIALCVGVLCAVTRIWAQPFVGLNASYANLTVNGHSNGTFWGPELEAGYRFGTRGAHAVKISYQTYRWNNVAEYRPPPMPDGATFIRSNIDLHFEALHLAYELDWPLAGGTVQAFFSPGVGAVRFGTEVMTHYEGGFTGGGGNVYSSIGTPWRFALEGSVGLRWQVSKAWNLSGGYGYLYRKEELIHASPPDPGANRQTEVSRLLIGVSYRY